MGHHVFPDSTSLSKHPVTLGTFKRLLPSVIPQVSLELVVPREGLAAELAMVGFLGGGPGKTLARGRHVGLSLTARLGRARGSFGLAWLPWLLGFGGGLGSGGNLLGRLLRWGGDDGEGVDFMRGVQDDRMLLLLGLLLLQ
jgi:hypothetical protein